MTPTATIRPVDPSTVPDIAATDVGINGGRFKLEWSGNEQRFVMMETEL